jgi:hypothetical protein
MKKIPAGAKTWNELLLKKYIISEVEGLPPIFNEIQGKVTSPSPKKRRKGE